MTRSSTTDVPDTIGFPPEEPDLSAEQLGMLNDGYGSVLTRETIYRMGWKACRTAMLKSAPKSLASADTTTDIAGWLRKESEAWPYLGPKLLEAADEIDRLRKSPASADTIATNEQVDAAFAVAQQESGWSINRIDTVRRMVEAALRARALLPSG